MAQRDDSGGFIFLLFLVGVWGWFAGWFSPKKKEEEIQKNNIPDELKAPEDLDVKEQEEELEQSEEVSKEEGKGLKEEVSTSSEADLEKPSAFVKNQIKNSKTQLSENKPIGNLNFSEKQKLEVRAAAQPLSGKISPVVSSSAKRDVSLLKDGIRSSGNIRSDDVGDSFDSKDDKNVDISVGSATGSVDGKESDGVMDVSTTSAADAGSIAKDNTDIKVTDRSQNNDAVSILTREQELLDIPNPAYDVERPSGLGVTSADSTPELSESSAGAASDDVAISTAADAGVIAKDNKDIKVTDRSQNNDAVSILTREQELLDIPNPVYDMERPSGVEVTSADSTPELSESSAGAASDDVAIYTAADAGAVGEGSVDDKEAGGVKDAKNFLNVSLGSYPTMVALITKLSSEVSNGDNDENTVSEKITIMTNYALSGMDEIAKYNNSEEYIKKDIYLNDYEVLDEQFFRDAYEKGDYVSALDDAIVRAKGPVQLADVEVVALGYTNVTMYEYQQSADDKVAQAKAEGKIKNFKDEIKIREDEAKALGVREYVSLNGVMIENFTLTSSDMPYDKLYNFLSPVAKSTVLKRRKQDEERNKVSLSAPDEQNGIDLDHKLYSIIFLETKGEFVEDFFVEVDGSKQLNFDKDGKFHFKPKDYDIDYSKHLDSSEMKKLGRNEEFSVKFKESFRKKYTYDDYLEWKEEMSPFLNSSDVSFELADAVLKDETVDSKFGKGGPLDIERYGRNFGAVNGKFAQMDKTENLEKYKDYYASSLLTTINKEMSNRREINYNDKINELRSLSSRLDNYDASSPSDEKAKKILTRYIDHQVEKFQLESDLKDLNHKYGLTQEVLENIETDKFNEINRELKPKKIDRVLESVHKDNIIDIDLYNLGSHNSAGDIRSFLDKVNDLNLNSFFEEAEEEKVFSEAPWVKEGVREGAFVARENLIPYSDRKVSKEERDIDSKVKAVVGSYGPAGSNEDHRSLALEGDLEFFTYPNKSNTNLTVAASTDGARLQYLSNPEALGVDKNIILPFARNPLDPSINQRGEVDITLKSNDFRSFGLKVEAASNFVQEKRSLTLDTKKIGIYGDRFKGGDYFSTSLKRQVIKGASGNLQSFGGGLEKSWYLHTTGDKTIISAGLDVSAAKLESNLPVSPTSPDGYKMLLEPKVSYNFINFPTIIRAAASAQIFGGFDDPYDYNSYNLNLSADLKGGLHAGQNVVLTDQFWLSSSQVGYNYRLFHVLMNTSVGYDVYNVDNFGKSGSFNLEHDVNIGKVLLNFRVSESLDDNVLNLPRNIESGVGVKFKF